MVTASAASVSAFVDLVPRGAVFLGQRTLEIPVLSKIEAVMVAKHCDPRYVAGPVADFVARALRNSKTWGSKLAGARFVFTISSVEQVQGAWRIIADVFAIPA